MRTVTAFLAVHLFRLGLSDISAGSAGNFLLCHKAEKIAGFPHPIADFLPLGALRLQQNVAVAKSLFLVVNKPVGRTVHLEINVGGRVQTNFGLVPVASAKKDRVGKLVIKI
jgi:hypothetical protein